LPHAISRHGWQLRTGSGPTPPTLRKDSRSIILPPRKRRGFDGINGGPHDSPDRERRARRLSPTKRGDPAPRFQLASKLQRTAGMGRRFTSAQKTVREEKTRAATQGDDMTVFPERICRRMDSRVATEALRTPISRVRSRTENEINVHHAQAPSWKKSSNADRRP